jgi:hypothetical protein
MRTRIAPAAASACPVCGHRLSPTDFVCTECGAVLALRAAHGCGPSTADRAKSRFIAVCHRGFSTLRSAIPKVVPGQHRWFYVVVALLATALIGAAVAGIFNRPDSAVDRGPSRNRERLEAQRAALPDRQSQFHRQEERRQSAVPPKAYQTRSSFVGSTALGMIGAGVVAALLCVVAVKSQRRRRDDQSADVRARRMTHAVSVAAAFSFGLAVALAVVHLTESRVVQPLPALAIGEGEHVDQWRREASTLKERLGLLDARLASLESTRAGDGQVRQQPARIAAIDHLPRNASRPAAPPSGAVSAQESNDVSNASVPADYEASVKPATADVLRPPRVPAGPTVADRVWNDVLRDWQHVRRTIRDLFPRDWR